MRVMQSMPLRRPRRVTMAEVRAHNARGDAWLVLSGKVYDVTTYMDYHPGGAEELLRGVGEDASGLFAEVHRWVNYEPMLARCLVGFLHEEGGGPSLLKASLLGRAAGAAGAGGSRAPGSVASAGSVAGSVASAGGSAGVGTELKGDGEWHRLAVVSKRRAGAQGVLLRLAIPEGRMLGLRGAGQHVDVALEGRPDIFRPYTPVSHPAARGFVDLLVKVYERGPVSSALARLSPASGVDAVLVRGPKGEFRYRRGLALWAKGERPRDVHALLLAGGGSGITPLLQIARTAVSDPEDHTPVFLALFHHSVDAIIGAEQVADIVAEATKPDQLRVATFVSVAPDGAALPDGVRLGRASPETLRDAWPRPAAGQVVAWCGPPGFNAAVDAAARALLYSAADFFQF